MVVRRLKRNRKKKRCSARYLVAPSKFGKGKVTYGWSTLGSSKRGSGEQGCSIEASRQREGPEEKGGVSLD